MIWDVNYTENSEQDLQEIFDYISDVLLVPETADKQVSRIMETVESLNFMPFRHPVYDYEPWRSRGVRAVPVDNYLIFYLPNEPEGAVEILRIIYARRDI